MYLHIKPVLEHMSLRTGQGIAQTRLRSKQGQATVEAAFTIPVLFTLLLVLLQPGIVLYDRMVMQHAAAEGCRLLATRSAESGLDNQRCIQLIQRQLSAIPPHDLFHVHQSGCTWHIEVSGSDTSSQVQVSIRNTLRLLPLFDMAGSVFGLTDANGCIQIQVECSQPTQASWVQEGSLGLDPQSWVHARKEEA